MYSIRVWIYSATLHQNSFLSAARFFGRRVRERVEHCVKRVPAAAAAAAAAGRESREFFKISAFRNDGLFFFFFAFFVG